MITEYLPTCEHTLTKHSQPYATITISGYWQSSGRCNGKLIITEGSSRQEAKTAWIDIAKNGAKNENQI